MKSQIPKKKIKKGAKKKFYPVSVPLTTTKVQLYAYSPDELVNKTIKLDMTKSLRGRGLEFKSKIKLVSGELIGEVHSLKLIPSYIKRVIRRGTDYIEDSFETQCKDAILRIKPFMITRKRVSREIRKVIRETAKKHLESKLIVRNSQEIFSEIMTNKIQKELSIKIKKIYPLALCEIRALNVVKKLSKKK
jgi:ribosomal protein S3AE